jgi:Tfp pilus assembly protein PilV
VELVIAMAILAVAIMALVSSITSSGQIQQNTRERVIAYNAAREMIEKMRVYPVGQIYSRYNSSTADDAFYTGSHPGPTFHVPRLAAPKTVPTTWSNTATEAWSATTIGGVQQLDSFSNAIGNDGYGLVTFPETGGILKENYVDSAMGMPKDLDRDGVVSTTADVSQSYKILPVKVTVSWSGIGGKDMTIEVNTFLTDK